MVERTLRIRVLHNSLQLPVMFVPEITLQRVIYKTTKPEDKTQDMYMTTAQ